MDFSQAHGKFENEVHGGLNDAGKAAFLERWKSSILGSQVLSMLKHDAQKSPQVNKSDYGWHDPATGDTIIDGLSIAYLTIEMICPNDKVNVFAKIEKNSRKSSQPISTILLLSGTRRCN